MFGVSFTELMLIGVVALIVVGPQRLPGMMATVGKWSSKMRRMLFDVRQQSGIDDILRAEGITGGLNEIRALRNAVRGNVQSLTQSFTSGPKPAAASAAAQAPVGTQPAVGAAVSPPIAATALAVESDPYANVPYDRSREYPDEGCDAYGAIPDDLWAATQRPVKPFEPPAEPPALAGASEAPAEAVDAPATEVPSEGVPSEGVPSEGVPSEGVPSEGVPQDPEPPNPPTATNAAAAPDNAPAGAAAAVDSEPLVPEEPAAPSPSSSEANASTAT